ncbi:hypothetical protein Tco_0093386 [Tanacetum coccineum]
MVSVVLAGCSRVVGLVGGFGCGVKCLRSNQNSLLAIWVQLCGKWKDGRERESLASATSTCADDDQVQGDLRCRSSKLSTYPLILSHFLYQDVVIVGILATPFYSTSHKRQPTSLAYENERNLKFIDAFDVKPIGGDSPKSLLQDKEVLVVADNGSVRADEIPRGSTNPFDDNLWREGRENTCRVIIQGLSPNAHIHAHANNDLPWPYATGGERGITENSGERSREEIKGAWYEAYQLYAAIQDEMPKEAATTLSEETQATEIHPQFNSILDLSLRLYGSYKSNKGRLAAAAAAVVFDIVFGTEWKLQLQNV